MPRLVSHVNWGLGNSGLRRGLDLVSPPFLSRSLLRGLSSQVTSWTVVWQQFRPSHLYSGSRNETEEVREERECGQDLVKRPACNDLKETPVWRAHCSQPPACSAHYAHSGDLGLSSLNGELLCWMGGNARGCQKLNQREKFTLPLMLQLTKVPIALMACF